KVLYDADKGNPIRKSHENPAIKELYATYLGEPGSEKAHHLLHTTYVKRTIN
ncbi:MAG: iron hydrogenase small subunit, partial [Hungatella sp.]